MTAIDDTSSQIAAMSVIIDSYNAHRSSETQTWARLAKITEEAGEAIAAFIGVTGQNPRKGATHTTADLQEELLDVALTALGVIEHLRGHDAQSLRLLTEKTTRTLQRLTPPAESPLPARVDREGEHRMRSAEPSHSLRE